MRIAQIIVTLLPALSLLPASSPGQTPVQQARRPEAPLRVRTMEGRTLDIQGLKGKVVLLDFMTTTCPLCKRASASLERLHKEFGPKGLLCVGVALNVAEPHSLKGYCQEQGVTFAMGTADLPAVAGFLDHPPQRTFLVPTLVLMDRQGRVREVEVGWSGDGRLRTSIARLLAR